MVAHATVCVRRLAGGCRAQLVRYGRFLANPNVTVAALPDGWGEQTARAATSRHVLAIQDTSAVHFRTTEGRRRGLGEVGHGNIHGLLVHAMLALDAATGSCLGLVGGRVWTRSGHVRVTHNRRALADKASERGLTTAGRAKEVLAAATMVTVIADRASDLYAALRQAQEGDGARAKLSYSDARHAGPSPGQWRRAVRDRGQFSRGRHAHDRAAPARAARAGLHGASDAALRHGSSQTPAGQRSRSPAKRAPHSRRGRRTRPPAGVEPLHRRRLTTHDVTSVDAAWQIVAWDKLRRIIEQLFRIPKKQGLQLEDSQIASTERLLKLATIATKAAALILQLVQARDRRRAEPASLAFTQEERAALEAVNAQVEGKTEKQKNPHTRRGRAWAAWIIARLGGWPFDKLRRLLLLPAARSHHLQAWPGILSRPRYGMGAEKCVHPLVR